MRLAVGGVSRGSLAKFTRSVANRNHRTVPPVQGEPFRMSSFVANIVMKKGVGNTNSSSFESVVLTSCRRAALEPDECSLSTSQFHGHVPWTQSPACA